MASIILHQIGSISVGLDRKDGYLNATKLCAAYNTQHGTFKQPSDWTKNKKAKDYIAYVSTIRNIPREQLVFSKAGNTDESGTWIHPDLADPFASWLSVEYEFAVSQWLQEWRANKGSNSFPENLTGKIEKNPEEAAITSLCFIVENVLSGTGLAPQLLAGAKATAIAVMFPQYRPAIEGIKKDLLLTVESKLLNATELAAIWETRTGEKLSAIAFNKKLEAANLQAKTGEKALPWRAIGCGIDHSEIVLDTARGHAKTVQRLMWHESVLDLL